MNVSGNRFKEYLANRQPPPQVVDQAIAFSLEFDAPVFPCRQDKRPITPHGHKDASRDPDTIRRLFAAYGSALIGMPTGAASGYDVLDTDIKDGRQGGAWLVENQLRLPETLTSRTMSGGGHRWFIATPGLRNSASRIHDGVDIRAEGGYVVVPPSCGYSWVKQIPAVAMPGWLVTLAMAAREPEQRPAAPAPAVEGEGTSWGLGSLARACEALRTCPDGAKHTTLNREAWGMGGLVTSGDLDEATALAALTEALETRRSTIKSWPAAMSTLRRAFAEGMGKPRESHAAPPVEEHPAAQFLAKLAARQAKRQAEALPVPAELLEVPGAIGMLVEECQRTAIRPQPFLALGAAICAVGALAGRRYESPSGLRTNVYIAAVAESGAGKDHAPSVVRRAINAAGLDRYLGGEDLASGSGLLTSLTGHPARLFILDELGMFLHSVTGKNAAAHKAEIWAEFMKLYSRAKEKYNGKEYANKDGKKERQDIWYPHPVVYGMTTPSTFWSALESGAMLDGGLARFLLFVSDIDLPERNKRPGASDTPPELIEALQALTRGAGALPEGNGNLPALHCAVMSAKVGEPPYRVPMTDAAEAIHDRHMAEDQDAWALRMKGTAQVPIISRLGENALKLALIRAISADSVDPLIGPSAIEWGWALALHCTRTLLKDAGRFIADSEYERKLNKALDIITRHGPITEYEMLRKGFKALGKDTERRELLKTLLDAGQVSAVAQEGGRGGGRPTVRYSINRTVNEDTAT